jgi:predicted nucleic acid-binding protein
VTAIIADTRAILAIFDESYDKHAAIAQALEKADDLLVVSPMVVAEADYMLASRLGAQAARRFAADIACEAYDPGRVDLRRSRSGASRHRQAR